MKKDNLIMYIIETSLIVFLLFCILFTRVFTKIIIGIILLVFMIISNKLIKSYKLKGKYKKEVTKVLLTVGLIYLSLIYILGIYVGFYNSTIKLSLWSTINYIIPYILIIISIENIRKTILLKKYKKSATIILIASVMLDIVLTANIYSLNSLNDYYFLIGFITFSSIANNLLYNYIIKEYRNSNAIIIYRLITTIYVYIIPIIPNINILFESILRIIVPYLIYLLLEAMYSKKDLNLSKSIRTKDIFITSILTVFVASIIMLISCQFKYGVLVIGSGSMAGTINKGDAIIYTKLDNTVEIGDIIVFYRNNERIIHRVIEKKQIGTNIKYYTKGDANPEKDIGYIEEKDIIGKVKLKIPYVGQLTLLLNEAFK